ncbi:hypothetical protein RRG08_054880 [Elysia crispata]|uniref:Uncharacterized protein n=1 Tax=Elysia crispata TaxID=231223 RepID=A0AAE1A6T8_9GAST|nr:hypothetical protein RRG08_054880 [Elysia crispata]
MVKTTPLASENRIIIGSVGLIDSLVTIAPGYTSNPVTNKLRQESIKKTFNPDAVLVFPKTQTCVSLTLALPRIMAVVATVKG